MHPPASAPPLSALLVGLGGMGTVWLRALAGPEAASLGVRLAAVCDVDAERGRAALAAEGIDLPLHVDVAEAIRGHDIVIDCTGPTGRIAVTAVALQAGAHVLCETPLSADEESAARLLGAAARAPGFLAVSQNRRFQPGLRQLRRLVAEGSLGRPQTLSATLHMAPRFGDVHEEMRHVMLRDMAIHAFDAARAILGTDAMSVTCVERTPEGSRFRHGPEVHALFEMAGGPLFSFHGNWTEAGPPTSWNGTWRLTFPDGAARWNGEGLAEAWRAAPPDAPGFLPDAIRLDLPPPPEARTGVLGVLESLVTAIRASTLPETNARSNARSLAMVFAAIRSAEAGGPRELVHDLGARSDASGVLSPRRHLAGNS